MTILAEKPKSAVREKPILFSGPMVRAILEGRKTQTRRIAKEVATLQPGHKWRECLCMEIDPSDTPCVTCACRFDARWEAGDRLWVRETFALHPEDGSTIYRCDRGGDYQGAAQGYFKWKPSIFMPRAASRITLEITRVRVERLQEISEEDAREEGVPGYSDGSPMDYRWGFQMLWDSINGKTHPWESNPYVWCISFKRI